MSELYPLCPICNKSDKVEKVAEIVSTIFSVIPKDGSQAVHWSGTTYYIPIRSNITRNGRLSERVLYRTPEQSLTLPLQKEANLLPILLEPSKPSKKLILGLVPSIIWIFLFLFFFWSSIMSGNTLAAILILILLVFTIFTFLFLFSIIRLINNTYKTALKEFIHKKTKLKEAEKIWEMLYYCYRDEGVFTINSSFVPLSEVDKFLFQ